MCFAWTMQPPFWPPAGTSTAWIESCRNEALFRDLTRQPYTPEAQSMPLYSMLWLVPVGIVLLALWHSRSAPNFIFGLYLALTGIGRFVEEAYRGEVQTRVPGKLRLYQWTALLSAMIGIVFTLFRVEMPALHPGFQWQILWSALAGGLFLLFAPGVDFPFSNRRFSRLV
ncbi:MAG TPA: prolipoprotein diacylglyceryl transferase family protein [Robiginitalea sp.]|nr:prolipoprotein diacylglyceryl transferase family protein [Robiginitalea sp.]